MQKKTKRPYMAYGLITVLLLAAVFYVIQPYLNKKNTAPGSLDKPNLNVAQIAVPDFNPDSAFLFVKKQVDFGPRVPNTSSHKKCGEWLVKEFKRFGFTVIEQKLQAPYYKGGTFNGVNIIAQYKPEASKRICIAAHWDTRNEADKDTKDINKPIDGADDGGSGVGILLELARTLQNNPVDVGVDLICFDLEDNGDDQGTDNRTWCLGAQYWSKNVHRAGYSPYYAILLDLVGAKGARFYKEGNSMDVAPRTVNMVWELAASLGYKEYFLPEKRQGITDDHYFVIQNAGIPMIDIISMPSDKKTFGDHHHTHADNMSIIDKNVLKAVGQTMTAFVYQTSNGVL